MEELKKMKECLMSQVEAQVYGNLDKVDTKELGEAIDMIKDLSEAIYYCTITEAMGKEDKEGAHSSHTMYYNRSMPMRNMEHSPELYDPRYRARYNDGTMYASNGGSGSQGGGMRGSSAGNYTMYHRSLPYEDGEYPMPYYRDGMMHDPQEGRSGKRRKMYMEGKNHKDKAKQMQELEAYMQELAEDMAEMIQDASTEEKQLLQSKINTLAQKIK